ncbi:MAG: SDR family NAD(P)-dependent oxidoreductase [Chloroflexi bacterium]|nr:SDR family NAD(P)-dependent oxidoreductase [Chloroflexota bacterium]
MSLAGKKAMVTGGSRGIGLQISRIFLENGIDVLAVSRDSVKLDQAKNELPELDILQADVSVPDDNDRVAAWVQDSWGVLDILVNNAGVSPGNSGALSNLPDEEFERTLRINVSGPYLCTKRMLPLLLKSKDPRIVNVGSTSGVMSSNLRGVYGVSKAALHALTIATANELRGKVAVNALSTGWVRTDMAPNAPGDPRTSAEVALWLIAQTRDVTGKLFHDKAQAAWGS